MTGDTGVRAAGDGAAGEGAAGEAGTGDDGAVAAAGTTETTRPAEIPENARTVRGPSGPQRLGRAGRLWRAGVTSLVLAALFYGSAWGSDDDFPLGPMTQFAFAVESDGGEIHSHWLEADTTAGTRVKLPMDAVGAGLKRAEVEGQVDLFARDPSLLQGIADAQRRLHPDRPAYTKIYVVKQIRTLRKGRVVSTSTMIRVSWEVR